MREIPFGRPWIDDQEKSRVMDVLNGHILTHGPQGTEFEEKFAAFTGSPSAVTTSSCMASLHLASIHFGLEEGDEVIVPAQTHVATVHAIEIVGAIPVFVDCELETGNIDINLIEQAITPKTKAISLVHFVGIPVDMKKLMQLADAHNLIVIEDCAIAIGSTVDGKHVGLWGDIGCFSFYPVKHITTGEGGMLICKDTKNAEAIAHFRAFSVDRKHNERKIPGVYDVTGVGLNYRMSEMQAAMGCVQVDKLPDILNRRERNFKALKQGLLSLPNIHVLDSPDARLKNSYYCLTAVLQGKLASQRTDLIEFLKSRQIGTSVYYPQPVPRMTYYQEKYGYDAQKYKNAATISDHSIALPVGPHLNEEDMAHIVNAIADMTQEKAA